MADRIYQRDGPGRAGGCLEREMVSCVGLSLIVIAWSMVAIGVAVQLLSLTGSRRSISLYVKIILQIVAILQELLIRQ